MDIAAAGKASTETWETREAHYDDEAAGSLLPDADALGAAAVDRGRLGPRRRGRRGSPGLLRPQTGLPRPRLLGFGRGAGRPGQAVRAQTAGPGRMVLAPHGFDGTGALVSTFPPGPATGGTTLAVGAH